MAEKALGIKDPYFDWWFQRMYGENLVPLHVCARQAGQCRAGTLYPEPLHMDVFRVLPGRSAMGLGWLSDDEKKAVKTTLAAVSPGGAAPEPRGSGGDLAGEDGAVATGEEGIQGLADALGSKPRAEARGGEEDEPVKRKQQTRSPKQAAGCKKF